MPKHTNKTIDTALKSMADDGGLKIRISGSCMVPLIQDGALVSIIKQAKYYPGDVIVKRCHDDQLMAHRLIGWYPHKGGLLFVTRADNARVADRGVPISRIIGRVSGGECSKSVVSVPTKHRIRGLGQFTLLVVKQTWHRFRQPGKSFF